MESRGRHRCKPAAAPLELTPDKLMYEIMHHES